jgi:hypothetical protein
MSLATWSHLLRGNRWFYLKARGQFLWRVVRIHLDGSLECCLLDGRRTGRKRVVCSSIHRVDDSWIHRLDNDGPVCRY